jgi:DUF4097 and DUF4098 domain-containing protein YvlB
MRIIPAIQKLLPIASLCTAATTAFAQSSANFVDNCRRNRSDDARVCETRNLAVTASGSLAVDGQQNGGITVHAWDRADIQVVAMVQAQAETEAEAQAIARQITIASSNGTIRATGPDADRRQSWSVSYEVWAPRATNLGLTAHNGGISVDGIEANMNLQTVNGGLDLRDVSGEVHGITTNGGITADLGGDRWRGSGLDLRTSNGGVQLRIPTNYSATLETGTVNGDLDIRIPITVQGLLTRQISTQLGAGGATVRATTTNGGVSIRPR